MNFTLDTNDCQIGTISIQAPELLNGDIGEGYFGYLASGACGGDSRPENIRIALISAFGNQTSYLYPLQDPAGLLGSGLKMSILNSTQVICKPGYTLSRYNLVQNGSQFISLDAVPTWQNTHKMTTDTFAWNLADKYINSICPPFNFEYGSEVARRLYSIPQYGFTFTLDRCWAMALFTNPNKSQSIDTLPDPTRLSAFFEPQYQLYAATIAHYLLPESAPLFSTGTARATQNRLVVHPPATHMIASLLGLAGIPTAFQDILAR